VSILPVAAQIARPQLGYVVDAGGALRPVIGIAAAASLGDSALDHASSFACGAKICLAKTDTALVPFAPANAAGVPSTVSAQSTPALAGPALIAIDDRADAQAWIYFADSRQMALWQDGALNMVDFAPGGEILSLRAAADGFDYAVARDFGPENLRRRAVNAWIEHYSPSDGSITVVGPAIAASPFATTAAMLIDGGVLAATSGELILARPDGQQMTFPLLGAQAFYSAGQGYVEIVAADGLWILRTDPGNEQLSMLPGVPAAEVAGTPAEAAP